MTATKVDIISSSERGMCVDSCAASRRTMDRLTVDGVVRSGFSRVQIGGQSLMDRAADSTIEVLSSTILEIGPISVQVHVKYMEVVWFCNKDPVLCNRMQASQQNLLKSEKTLFQNRIQKETQRCQHQSECTYIDNKKEGRT